MLGLFKSLVQEPDTEWEFMDGTLVRAHQHSSGAASEEEQAIGKSRRGNTRKIHWVVAAHGVPIDFEISGGEVNDCTVELALIARIPAATAVVADKGHDSEKRREQITAKGRSCRYLVTNLWRPCRKLTRLRDS